jgi:aryl-alcohol dehydrogenase-like predicted oxidoreductase
MKKVKLGRTGLEVNVMGLGCGGDSRLGLTDGNEEGAARLVRAAIDQGIDFIDTAEVYGTESAVGLALSQIDRTKVVVSTKKTTFETMPLEPEDIERSLDASLARLRTDYVDIYHLHGVRPSVYASLRERIVPELLRLKEKGKIRFLGITEAFLVDPGHKMLAQALEDDFWDVVMVGFNILNQSARRSVFPRTQAKNVGTLVMFAVRRAFSRPERLRELLSELGRRGLLSEEVERYGLEFVLGEGARSLPDAAYRFCLNEPGVHVVLSGTGSEQHLLENIASLSGEPLKPELRARLVRLFEGVGDVSGH